MASSIGAAFADPPDMQNCQKDDEQSFAACTKIVEDNTTTPYDRDRAYTARGNAWLDVKHDYDRAIADYTAAIGTDPGDPTPYYNRGLAWDDKGDQNRAIADYNEAIRLNPKDPDAYVNRSNAWYQKGNDDRCIADADEAISLNPKIANSHLNRGLCFSRKGDQDHAIADFDTAISLDPNDARAYANRGGILLYRQNKYDLAIVDYSTAIRLDPKTQFTTSIAAMPWTIKATATTPSPITTKRSVSIQMTPRPI